MPNAPQPGRRRVRWPSWLLVIAIMLALLGLPAVRPSVVTSDAPDCSGGDRRGVVVAFLLDSSQQMAVQDRDGLRRSVATALVNGLSPQAKAAVIDLGDQGHVVQGLTSDKAALIGALGQIDDAGRADLTSGISEVLPQERSSW